MSPLPRTRRQAIKCFFKRLHWCWQILKGTQFALFFVRGEDLRACKYREFTEADWWAIADFTQQVAIYSGAEALARFEADLEAAEDEQAQAALLAEARHLLAPKP